MHSLSYALLKKKDILVAYSLDILLPIIVVGIHNNNNFSASRTRTK